MGKRESVLQGRKAGEMREFFESKTAKALLFCNQKMALGRKYDKV